MGELLSLNCRRLPVLEDRIFVSGYVSQDPAKMVVGDAILLRRTDGAYALGTVESIEGEGEAAVITPCCQVLDSGLDCVVGKLEIVYADARFEAAKASV